MVSPLFWASSSKPFQLHLFSVWWFSSSQGIWTFLPHIPNSQKDAVDNFVGLFYYIFTGERTSKAERFDNLRSLKILNTPLTQNWKRPGIRKKRPEQEQTPQTRKGAIRRAWRMRPFPAKHPSGYTPGSSFYPNWMSLFPDRMFFFRIGFLTFSEPEVFFSRIGCQFSRIGYLFFFRIGNPFFRCGCLFFPGLALAVFFFRIGCLVPGAAAFCSGIVCLFFSITNLFSRSVAFFQH